MLVWYSEITVKLLKYGLPYNKVDFREIMLRSHAPAFFEVITEMVVKLLK